MRTAVNRFYGVLSGGPIAKGTTCYRFSNVSRSSVGKGKKNILDMLIPEGADDPFRAVAAETCIQLLRTADNWNDLLDQYDHRNTYQNSVSLYAGIDPVITSDPENAIACISVIDGGKSKNFTLEKESEYRYRIGDTLVDIDSSGIFSYAGASFYLRNRSANTIRCQINPPVSLTMDTLSTWANSAPIGSLKYPNQRYFTKVDKIINLLCILLDEEA